jgi:hypothetical protein
MALVRWTYEEFLRYVRGIVVLKAFWSDKQALVRQALAGAEIVHYRYDPNSWPPSVLVAKAGDRYEVYANGTSNGWQVFSHVKGSIGVIRKNGVTHYGMAWAGDQVEREVAPYLPAPDAPGQVDYYGHSYGGGVVQYIADKRVDAGADPASIWVTTYGSPKLFTNSTTINAHRVELIMSNWDPIWTAPPDWLPILAWDSVSGWVPWRKSGDYWALKGNRNFHVYTNRIEDDVSAINYNAAPDKTLSESLAWHFYDGYLTRLIEVATSERRFRLDQRYQDLIAINRAIDEGDQPAATFAGSTWLPGLPSDPFDFSHFSLSGASKGGAMAKAIKVQLYFSNKNLNGWTETHYYRNQSDSPATVKQARAATKRYLAKRAALFTPKVRYGVHLQLDAARFSEEGSKRVGHLVRGFEFTAPTYPADGTGATGVEPPGDSYLYRVFAGDGVSRLMTMRPIPDSGYIDKSGVVIPQEETRAALNAFMKFYRDETCWAIKAQDRTTYPPKTVQGITTTPLPAGQVGFVVPGHGYQAGQEIIVEGGKPFHKPARGKYVVDLATTADQIVVRTAKPITAMSGGCTVRRVEYGYYLVDNWISLYLGHRDTGRPIAMGRGQSR